MGSQTNEATNKMLFVNTVSTVRSEKTPEILTEKKVAWQIKFNMLNYKKKEQQQSLKSRLRN